MARSRATGPVGVEQLDESAGEDAEVVVAFGGGGEQGFRRRGGVMEAVGGAVCAGESFLALKCFDVSGVFDLLSTVEGTAMSGEHDAGVEDAHGLEGGRDDEGASHVAVRNRVIVCIESRVGGLSHLDLDALFAGEGIVGQCEQMGALLGEDVGDGALAVLGAGTFGGAGLAPLVGLVIEVVDIVEASGVEEAFADKSDQSLHPALLISSRGRDGARLEAIVSGELKQRGMEADGVGAAFEHNAFHVVVEHDFGPTPERSERFDVAADEVGERGVEVEAHERITRVAEHQHERHQRALCTADGELAEVGPVDLRLLTGQGAKAKIRLTRATRTELRDAVAEVVGSAGVASRLDHVEQPCGGQRGEALKRFGDELHIRVKLRGASRTLALALDPCLAQHPLDGGVMDAELAGDGAHAPVLDEVVAQDLRSELVGDCHSAVRVSVPDTALSYRGAAPVETDELADRACTEVAMHGGGRFGGHRWTLLAHRSLMSGEFSTASGEYGTVMRHFLCAGPFAAPAPVAALALGMAVPAAPRLLIPVPRRTS